MFLCKRQLLHFKGQACHPKKCNLKGAWDQGCTPSRCFLGWESLGNIFGLGPSHAAVPPQELCNEASPAGVRGWKEVGEASTVPTVFFFFLRTTPPFPPPQGTVRVKGAARTTGFRIAPYRSQESVASLHGPRLEKRVGAVPRFGQRPPPCAFPDSERGQRASRNGGPRRRRGLRVARSIAAGNSGLALSVRAPGLPAAPRPRLRLTLSDGDAAGELLRSQRGNPEPPRAAGASFPPPRRPPRRAPHS